MKGRGGGMSKSRASTAKSVGFGKDTFAHIDEVALAEVEVLKPNHVKTTAGQLRIMGRDRALPAVIVPLLAREQCIVGTLNVDSFAVGQNIEVSGAKRKMENGPLFNYGSNPTNPTQPNPTQPNPTQPNPTQPNPTQRMIPHASSSSKNDGHHSYPETMPTSKPCTCGGTQKHASHNPRLQQHRELARGRQN